MANEPVFLAKTSARLVFGVALLQVTVTWPGQVPEVVSVNVVVKQFLLWTM